MRVGIERQRGFINSPVGSQFFVFFNSGVSDELAQNNAAFFCQIDLIVLRIDRVNVDAERRIIALVRCFVIQLQRAVDRIVERRVAVNDPDRGGSLRRFRCAIVETVIIRKIFFVENDFDLGGMGSPGYIA